MTSCQRALVTDSRSKLSAFGFPFSFDPNANRATVGPCQISKFHFCKKDLILWQWAISPQPITPNLTDQRITLCLTSTLAFNLFSMGYPTISTKPQWT